MSRVPHELIRASAGTGKTYQLTNRYLRLLFETESPERIIALTFTRKAAGEFFEKIFHRLASAAATPEASAELGAQLGLVLSPAHCLAALRLLLDRMHRLQLSTYDSFFARIVQAFPFELGLSASPRMLNDQQRQELMLQTQRALLELEEGEEERLRDFWHAFKLATLGREEKRSSELLNSYIDEHQNLYLENPDAQAWGVARRIWGGACPWAGPAPDFRALAIRFGEVLPWKSLTTAQAKDWREFLTALCEWKPPTPLTKDLLKFAKKFAAVYKDLLRGKAEISIRKKQQLGAEECALAAELTRALIWSELEPRLKATQGLHALVHIFEVLYRESVRGQGLLTISDMTRLLCGQGAEDSGLANEEFRMQLDYRLDSSFDHWLLDEFQDTSHSQWRAISNLVDEVLQDVEGRRSFFAVGDTKQCLYMWRGSDDKLFDRIWNRYQACLEQRTLSESYRSAPAVLDMVNSVFGAQAALAEVVGPVTCERWARMWTEHISAGRLREVSGHAAWLCAADEDKECTEELRKLLFAIDPIQRGLSVAILTQTNDQAKELVDFIRAHTEMPCSLAAEVKPGADNAATVALASLLQVVAHPGDSLAWKHLAMSALATLLSKTLLRVQAQGGVSALVEQGCVLVQSNLALADEFSLERLDHCRDAARDFDARGEVDLDLFLRELESLSIRETDIPGQLAVMTIHKAKGLDWDIVILPQLKSNSLRIARRGMGIKRDAAGEIEWVLQMPPKDFALADPVLEEQLRANEDDAAFENLCLLYVAMTRARRGLYVLTEGPRDSESMNYLKLLGLALGDQLANFTVGEQTFSGLWESGQGDWFCEKTGPEQESAETLTAQVLHPDEWLHGSSPTPVVPSQHAESMDYGLSLSDEAKAEAAMLFGSEVHRALQQLEWLPEDAAGDAAWISSLQPPLNERGQKSVLAALARPEFRRYFIKPSAEARVWREQAFELLDGNNWISGRVDRAILQYAEGPLLERVTIVDFKTTAARKREIFQTQLEGYCRSFSKLLGLPESQISAEIAFVE